MYIMLTKHKRLYYALEKEYVETVENITLTYSAKIRACF